MGEKSRSRFYAAAAPRRRRRTRAQERLKQSSATNQCRLQTSLSLSLSLSSLPKSRPHTHTPSRHASLLAQRACGGERVGRQAGVSWSATYLHPNIKPLRLPPIILDKSPGIR